MNSAFNQVDPLFPSFDGFQQLLTPSPHNDVTEFLTLVACTYVPGHLGPTNTFPGIIHLRYEISCLRILHFDVAAEKRRDSEDGFS